MTQTPTTITPLATYRNDTPYPFCPGCGHGLILNALNDSLLRLHLDPRQVVLVSDIGCAGLSDQYFNTNAFHGLHGRSVTYASGIKLARPELKVVVIMGDGGTGIGGTHLLNAARRNIGVTVLVFNNLNFGMTGGQHSTTTPTGAVTSTTLGGNLERPLDICATVAVNGASYVWRGTTWDRDLSQRIAEAISEDGFGLLDIWELCTAYFVPHNRFSRKELLAKMKELGLETGVLQQRSSPEYAVAYRQEYAGQKGQPALPAQNLRPCFQASLEEPFRLVVAGSAGGKVRSATRLAGQAAILSGLWAAQRDDYPITVQTGHSVSELILSPQEILYTGVSRPDALLVLTHDGARKAARYTQLMQSSDRIFAVPELTELHSDAPVTRLDPARASVRVTKTNLALVLLAAVLAELGLFPQQALEAAARLGPDALRQETLEALRAGLKLVGSNESDSSP